MLEKSGYIQDTKKKAYNSIYVNFDRDLDSLLASFKKKSRYNIRNAKKKDLEIQVRTDNAAFDEVIGLYNEMVSLKKFKPGIDIYKWKEIFLDLEDSMKMAVILCYYNNRPVSTLVVSPLGKIAVGIIGATNIEGRKLKASYLTQWEELKYLKGIGCISEDLGGINPKKNSNVYGFKKSFSGDEVTHIGVFNASKNLLLNMIGQFM